MPSKEEMCFFANGVVDNNKNCLTANTKDFLLSLDMEELVLKIKENLRLNGLKSRSSYAVHSKASRPSPYRLPSDAAEGACCEDCLKAASRHCGGGGGGGNGNGGHHSHSHSCLAINNKNIKSKSSVASSADDPYEMLQELLRDGSLIKEAVRRLEMGLSPKQRYFYDSDEESRTPLRDCNGDL